MKYKLAFDEVYNGIQIVGKARCLVNKYFVDDDNSFLYLKIIKNKVWIKINIDK